MEIILYFLAAIMTIVIFAGHATNEDEDTLSILAGAFWPVTAVILTVETIRYCWHHR